MSEDRSKFEGMDAVAIIGFSGKFPGSEDVDAFWKNLVEGKECISTLTDEELKAAGVNADVMNHAQYVKAGSFIDGVENFDAGFFGYNPREAEYADPQQRHLMECAWSAFEHAGYDIERSEVPVGVYVSGAMSTYIVHMLERENPNAPLDRFAAMLGNDKDSLSTRISYRFNLKGPSYSIQSQCSSSLVATHVACQGLLDGECDMALAGGITIRVPHRVGYFYQPGSINSPDGHCRPFDAKAQGTVFGNGMGLVVLKRLEDALEDRDSIYAIIRGSAVNNDGGVKAGYTAPSVDGQAAVVGEALAAAGVSPEDIDYIEAHGTGTALGDPTEMAALQKVFTGEKRQKPHLVGSCKSNIGHLDTASGIAGLIKTAQMLRHKRIPASLNYSTPNPEIDFFKSSFRVNAKECAWESSEGRARFAGVSSFGVGGTNAHVVLMEGVDTPSSVSDERSHLLPISARSETSLQKARSNLAVAVREGSLNLKDVAFTLQEGRKAFPYRSFAVVDDIEDVPSVFDSESELVLSGHCDGASPKVAFLFPGQGAQHINMAKELYTGESVFRETLDKCFEIALAEGVDLRSHLYPNNDDINIEEANASLSCTAIAQPVLFSVEYAMATLWLSWGVRPAALLGHSIGELVGACLAGVMTLDDALTLVICRGRIMNEQERGGMLALDLPMSEAEEWTNEDVVVAASNGPKSTVVSGSFEGIDSLSTRLADAGIAFKPVRTSHAFHSPMMDGAVATFTEAVKKVKLSKPTIPVYSNLTGEALSEEDATDPTYWGRQLRERVLFSQGFDKAIEEGCRVFLEVGPGQTLSSLARRQSSFDTSCRSVSSMPHAQAKKSGRNHLLESLGRLWLGGVSIDWKAHHGDHEVTRIALPTYSFDRSRYWYEGVEKSSIAVATLGKRDNISDWLYTPTWRRWRFLDGVQAASKSRSKWLVFFDKDGIAETFSRLLEERGDEVVRIRESATYGRQSDNVYSLDWLKSEDYLELIQDTLKQGRFDKVAHFGNIDSGNLEAIDNSPEGILNRSYYSLFFFSQALLRLGWRSDLKVCVFGNRLFDTLEGESIEPLKSSILGITRVLPKECRSISCHAIDIGDLENGELSESQTKMMLSIANIKDSEQKFPVVALRNGSAWVEELESISELGDETSEPLDFLVNGETVLVIGGLGGIGFEISKLIASEGKSNVAIITRRGLPDRSTWNDTSALSTEQQSQIEWALDLERATSIKVGVFAADISNETTLREVVATIENTLGPIRSLVHAAGIEGGGMIPLRRTEDIERVLSAKTHGVAVLRKVIDFALLRKLVLCSSLSAYLGEYAQSDYCAANCAMDAWAREFNREGIPAISINWDVWSEIGMSLIAGEPNDLVEKLRADNIRNFGMTSREGIAVFQRALRVGLSQVVVSTRSPTEWIDESKIIEEQLSAARSAPSPATTLHERPDCSTAYVEPKSDIEKTVAKVWESMLGIKEIGVNDDFLELGGHSLLATQVLNRISQDYSNVELTLADLFTTPTVKGLSQLIEDQISSGDSSILSLYDKLLPLEANERKRLIEAFLKERIRALYQIEILEKNTSLDSVLSETSSSELIWDLKRTLKLRFYPQEFTNSKSFGALCEKVSNEFERRENPLWVRSARFEAEFAQCVPVYPKNQSSITSKNPQAVFLHSAPRSGSTLLRVLLAGHSSLFSPPELGLLTAQTMSEWKSQLLSSFSAEGVVAAFANLRGCPIDEARSLVDDLTARDVSIKEVYRMLQDEAGGRLLIDKTPLYGTSIDVLRRSESYFENAKYIHLVRHPCSVIESIARNRLDRIFTQETVDPYRFAEDLWTECETNFQAFFDEIDSKRVFKLKYEDLTKDVEGTMRSLSDFLEIEYSQSLIDPYDGNRMASGLGDPDILNHNRIDSSLADTWKNIELPWPVREATAKIAQQHRYKLINDEANIADSVSMEDVDSMSEEELDRLLGELEV